LTAFPNILQIIDFAGGEAIFFLNFRWLPIGDGEKAKQWEQRGRVLNLFFEILDFISRTDIFTFALPLKFSILKTTLARVKK